jgi:hypothetical protein
VSVTGNLLRIKFIFEAHACATTLHTLVGRSGQPLVLLRGKKEEGDHHLILLPLRPRRPLGTFCRF